MTDALAGLEQLARDRTERDGLLARLDVATAHRDRARERLAEARSRLAGEREDVERLESVSVTRILAGLRGRRDVDLDRERAEAAAAQYAVAEAEARAGAEEREVQSLTSRINAHGDLDARRADLLAEREREIAADPGAEATTEKLVDLSERVGALHAEQTQLAEADDAGGRAHAALQEAGRHLGSAGSWATYDTFFGGGLMGDMVKHGKLDRAAALMRAADASLARLGTELADVGIGAVGDLGITDMTRALDVWFDNIFSDWAVRDRIAQASRRVDQLLATVGDVGRELAGRRAEVADQLEALGDERERLLTGAA